MKRFKQTRTTALLVAGTVTLIVAGGQNKGNNKNNSVTNAPTESINIEALKKAEFKAKWEAAEREAREEAEMREVWIPAENLSPIIRSGSKSAPTIKTNASTGTKTSATALSKDLKEKEADSAIQDRSFLTSDQHRLEIVDEDAAFQKPAEDKKFAETVKTEAAESVSEKPKKAEENAFTSSADAERANDERRKTLILAYEQGADLSAADLAFLGEDAKHLKRTVSEEPDYEPAPDFDFADAPTEDIAAENTFDFSSVSENEIKAIHLKYKNREMLTEEEMKIFEYTFTPRMPNKTLRANR